MQKFSCFLSSRDRILDKINQKRAVSHLYHVMSVLQPLSESDLVDEFLKDFSGPAQPVEQPKPPEPRGTSKVRLPRSPNTLTLIALLGLGSAAVLSMKMFSSVPVFPPTAFSGTCSIAT